MAGSNGNKPLSERIFAIKDIETEDVPIPEWGGVVLRVQSMTGLERAGFLERFMGEGGELNIEGLYPSLIIATCFDPETGEQVFQPGQEAKLNGKNSAALERLGKVALKLSGITSAAETALGKDSSPIPSGASTSS